MLSANVWMSAKHSLWARALGFHCHKHLSSSQQCYKEDTIVFHVPFKDEEHVANRSQGNLFAVTWRVRGRTGCGCPWAAFRPCAPNLYALQPRLMGHWKEVGRKWVEKGQRVFQKEKLMWIKGQRRATKGPPTGRLPASLIAVEVCAGKEDTEHPFSAWNIFLFLVPSPPSKLISTFSFL